MRTSFLIFTLAMTLLALVACGGEEPKRSGVKLKPQTADRPLVPTGKDQPVAAKPLVGNTIPLTITRLDSVDQQERSNPLTLTLHRSGSDWLVIDFDYQYNFLLDAWRMNDSLQVWLSGDSAYANLYQFYPLAYWGTSIRIREGFSSSFKSVEQPWEWGFVDRITQTRTSMTGRMVVRVPKLAVGSPRIAAVFMTTSDDRTSTVELPLASFPSPLNATVISPEEFPSFTYGDLPEVTLELEPLIAAAKVRYEAEMAVNDEVDEINRSVNKALGMIDRLGAMEEFRAAAARRLAAYEKAAQTLGPHAGNDYNILRLKDVKAITPEELAGFAERHPASLYAAFMMIERVLAEPVSRQTGSAAAVAIAKTYAGGSEAERRLADWMLTRVAQMLLLGASDAKAFLEFTQSTREMREQLADFTTPWLSILSVLAELYAPDFDQARLHAALASFPAVEERSGMLQEVISLLFPPQSAPSEIYPQAVMRLLQTMGEPGVEEELMALTIKAVDARRQGAGTSFDSLAALELLRPHFDRYTSNLGDEGEKRRTTAFFHKKLEVARILGAKSIDAQKLREAYQRVTAHVTAEERRQIGAELTGEIIAHVLRDLLKQTVEARRNTGLVWLQLMREYAEAAAPLHLALELGEQALELLDIEEADLWLGHAVTALTQGTADQASYLPAHRMEEDRKQSYANRIKRLNLGVELFRTAPQEEHVAKAWEDYLDIKLENQRVSRTAYIVTSLMPLVSEQTGGKLRPLLQIPAHRGRSVVAHEAANRLDALIAGHNDHSSRLRLAARMASHFADLRKVTEARGWLKRANEVYVTVGEANAEKLQVFATYVVLDARLSAIESGYPQALAVIEKRVKAEGVGEGEKTYLKEFQAKVMAAMKRLTDEAELIKAEAADLPKVRIVTDVGQLDLVLFEDDAPNTVANFLQLAEEGFFNGIAFHRFVPNFVAQGGDPAGDGSGGPGYGIKLEATRRHLRGTISMARSQHPDSAGSQFFLCLSDLSALHLDGGYAAFGRVTAGLEVMDRLREGSTILQVSVLNKRGHAYKVEKLPERE